MIVKEFLLKIAIIIECCMMPTTLDILVSFVVGPILTEPGLAVS
jgi:hypothetical protein